MPPYGLYPVAKHHLYSGPRRKQPEFSSLDYLEENEEMINEPQKGASEVQKDNVNAVTKQKKDNKGKEKTISEAEKKATKKDKRDKKKNKKERKQKKNRHRSKIRHEGKHTGGDQGVKREQTSNEGLITATSSPIKTEKSLTRLATKAPSSPEIKRNFDDQLLVSTPIQTLYGNMTGGFVVGGDLLDNLNATMGDLSAPFRSSYEVEEPVNKKKSGQKSKADTGREKAEKEGQPFCPVRDINNTTYKAQLVTAAKEATALPYMSTPKQTPIPVPQTSPLQPIAHPKSYKAAKDKIIYHSHDMLVPETPPSQLQHKSIPAAQIPIPFNLPRSCNTTIERKRSKQGTTILTSSPTPRLENPSTLITPTLETIKPRKINVESRIPSTQVPIEFVSYTQPLTDEPREPLGVRASSVATSVTTNASSCNIKDAFARAHSTKLKRQFSGTHDPFFSSQPKKEKREPKEESDANTFITAYRASQATVNFATEQQHLDKHIAWQAENAAAGPLPCLNIATGCNAKREEILRLSKEDGSNMFKMSFATNNDQATLNDAKVRYSNAENLMLLAVIARVPVPLGRIEGVWKLFCPKYSDTHVDNFGAGQRTLAISAAMTSSFSRSQVYTAQLNIPPRSMAYTISAFTPPPHASFRTIGLRTSAEQYNLEVVFLGNGHLQLRADLQLLLKGKPSGNGDGRNVIMEFVGVHEHALQWTKQKCVEE